MGAVPTVGVTGTGAVTGEASPGWIRNPVDPARRVRGVLFDVDGTLFRQGPVRAMMALELAALALTAPRRAVTTWRVVDSYRRGQERLRGAERAVGVPRPELGWAAKASALGVREVERVVHEWMIRRPARYLRWFRRPGLLPLLDSLGRAGARLGVLSDNPAHEKLAAMGLGDRFDPVICTSDDSIAAPKPHPRGFLVACAHWGLDPVEVLMVGDRGDVDARGAAAAGMTCVLVGAGDAGPVPPGTARVSSFAQLLERLGLAS